MGQKNRGGGVSKIKWGGQSDREQDAERDGERDGEQSNATVEGISEVFSLFLI